jgi:signal transduction histidine kinase
VDFSLKPIRDEQGRVVMLIPEGRDITELKLAQQRETAMLKALATIGESAAVLAHEIKNPITAVNLALRAVADQLGEGQAEILEDLASRMKRLEKLMRRTLAFTKPLELQTEPCVPAELVRSAIASLQPEVDARETVVECESEEAPEVLADASLIEEVLTNLLRNALDALDSSGHIVLSTRAVSAGLVEFVVEDDGPGITAASQDSLFRPFFTTKSDGTGLGLAICKKIIEEHGGEIQACSSELGGARFRFTLPVAPA